MSQMNIYTNLKCKYNVLVLFRENMNWPTQYQVYEWINTAGFQIQVTEISLLWNGKGVDRWWYSQKRCERLFNGFISQCSVTRRHLIYSKLLLLTLTAISLSGCLMKQTILLCAIHASCISEATHPLLYLCPSCVRCAAINAKLTLSTCHSPQSHKKRFHCSQRSTGTAHWCSSP